MPPKKAGKRKAKRKAPKMMQGEGIFGDIWSGIKKGFNYVKDNKLLSKGLALIPDSRAQTLARGASAVGLGKRRRPRKMKGMGIGVSPFLLDQRTVGASVIKT
jgi:hypothetical protein